MHDDWIARWRDGRIGFHEGRPNTFLAQHVGRFADRRRVLVPLCGKAEDLAFLAAHGHEVVGVELAEQAVREFVAAHGMRATVEPHGPFIAYRGKAITLLVGDMFALTAELAGPIDAIYDRAALVALPPQLRPGYVAQLCAVAPGVPGLVVTFEYDQSSMIGPPFSVPEAELRALYAGAPIECLGERPATGGGRLAQSGVPAIERCFFVSGVSGASGGAGGAARDDFR